MKLSSAKCLSLVQDDALWAAFLQPREAPRFVAAPANADGTAQTELRLTDPVNRRVIAALMTAMLKACMDKAAVRLFRACPHDRDRRLVLKCLLQRPGPPGGALRRLDKADHIGIVEQALSDMQACTDSQGQPRYAKLQPAIDDLRAHWRAQAAWQPLTEARQRLADAGCLILPGPEDHQRLMWDSRQPMGPSTLSALLDYFALSLQHDSTAPSVAGLMSQALACLGLSIDTPPTGRAGPRSAVPDWADESQRSMATDFVRQCSTLLLNAGRHPSMVEALLGLSLSLEDAALATDPAFAAAARLAQQRDGLIWAWTLSQLPSPGQFPEQLIRSLTEHLGRIQSAAAALVFIHGLTTGLATLQALAVQHKDAERESAWQRACQQLLPAMVKHFADLVRHKPDAVDQDWESLAQWVWVADAALNLTPSAASAHANCLSVLHQHHAHLAATLSLLCPADVLRVDILPSSVTAKHIQALFAACPLGTRQAVLRLPVPALWMSKPITLPIHQFFADNDLPPEQQAPQLVALIDAGVAMHGLPKVLAGLLDTASLAQLLVKREPNKEDAWWLLHALRGLFTQWRTTRQLQRPRALPNLLDLYWRITLSTSREERHGLWSNWKAFVVDCAGLAQLEAQDWALLGAYLPLGPEAGNMDEQIRQLSQTAARGCILVHLLRGWLAQRFAEAFDPARDTHSRAAEHEQFQAAWACTKGLMLQLTSEERKAMGIEVKTELKTLVRRYEALLKKS